MGGGGGEGRRGREDKGHRRRGDERGEGKGKCRREETRGEEMR